MTWQKWGSKQTLEKRKTSLSLMEVFNIALKCRVLGFGANETLHFRTTTFWAQLLLGVGV
jgi:hypothetical protein